MIARGKPCDSFQCPLALAFNAAGFDVMIAPGHVDFYDSAGAICATFLLPEVAQRFQRKFDDDQTPEPFEFDMPGLEPSAEPSTHFRSVSVAHALFGEVAAT